MDNGRGTRFEELMQRAVVALEKLAEDPILEMEIGPPLCPHCNQFNPVVHIPFSEEGEGRIFEFFVVFLCTNCDSTFYAMPTQWSMHKDKTTLELEVNGRAGASDRVDARQN